MLDRKRKSLEEIDKQIAQCKNTVNANEGTIISQLNKFQTPKKQPISRFQNEALQTGSDSGKRIGYTAETDQKDLEMINYIKNMKKLQGTLEEKSYLIQMNYERERVSYQKENQKLREQVQTLSSDLQKRQREVVQKDDTIRVLKNQVVQLQKTVIQLQKTVKQKQGVLVDLSKDMTVFRKQNVQMKETNKSIKADNKIIMNHIDRLTKQIKNSEEEKKELMSERELRVMKSLYQSTPPNEEQNRNKIMSRLTTNIIFEDNVEKGSELNTLVRKLNEQASVLRREKELLMQQNKQKTINLESQKMLTKMSEETNQKLNDLIAKMGDKLISLEQINQTLRESLRKLEEGEQSIEENYYRQTKAKAGQFYYKR